MNFPDRTLEPDVPSDRDPPLFKLNRILLDGLAELLLVAHVLSGQQDVRLEQLHATADVWPVAT